jgi:hypothetical protein
LRRADEPVVYGDEVDEVLAARGCRVVHFLPP